MGWHTALRVMVLPVVLPVNRLPPMPLGRDRSLTVLFVHSRERYRRMRIGSARSHFGCDPNRFHNFLLRSAMPQRGFCVALNAVWRLSHVRDGNRNELFGLSGQSTVGKVRFAECLQCGLDTGSEFAPFCWQVLSTLLDSLIPTFVALCFPFRIFFACSENPEGKTEGYKCRNQAIQKRRKNLPAKRRELAPSIQAALQTFSKADFTDGALPAKTKQLIAVAVAHVTQSPYCIQGHTKTALRHGATQQEIVEAIWVAAEMRAGGAYAHSPISLTAMDEQHGQAPVTA